MKSRAEISINFYQARNKANELEQLANRLDRIANNSFAGTMQDISRNWKGQSANQYLKKGSQLQTKMSNTSKQLRAVAEDIRTTAQRWYDAEMRAVQIAEAREAAAKYNAGGGGYSRGGGGDGSFGGGNGGGGIR